VQKHQGNADKKWTSRHIQKFKKQVKNIQEKTLVLVEVDMESRFLLQID